jgi:hypothetical protein
MVPNLCRSGSITFGAQGKEEGQRTKQTSQPIFLAVRIRHSLCDLFEEVKQGIGCGDYSQSSNLSNLHEHLFCAGIRAV